MEIHGIHANNTWKVQLMIVINFMSSKDTKKEKGMHSKSDNSDKIIKELFFVSIPSRYQIKIAIFFLIVLIYFTKNVIK